MTQDPISADLLARHEAREVPRYTSYPTAPHFSDAVGQADYATWLAALPATTRLSLYLHVPFCRSLCWYCGCTTRIVTREGPVSGYAASLGDEMHLVAERLATPLAVDHLHWGGGTPTILGADALGDLLDLVRRLFRVGPRAEIAVEIDPRRADADLLTRLVAHGVNRASLGVQSFDPEVQQAIHRVQSYEETRDAVEALRAAGVDGVNFDLLYGLPRQTVDSCLDTVQRALTLEPDRLAVFGYAHVPWIKKHQRMISQSVLPGAAERVAQSLAIAESLETAGYVRIGLDHFARPDDPLARALAAGTLRRNFQGYTTDAADALIGLGASSIGALPQGYVQNSPRTDIWQRRVAAGELPVERGIVVTPEDRLRRDAIEQIMCFGRLDLEAVALRHGTSIAAFDDARPALRDLEADGVVEWEGEVLRVRERAVPLLRTVAAAFDGHLGRQARRYSAAV